MDKYNDINRKISLLKGELEGTLTSSEKEELQQWLNESESHRETFRRLQDKRILIQKLNFRQQQEMETDWDRIRHRTGLVSSRRWYVHAMRYAAVFTGLLLATWTYFNFQPPHPREQLLAGVSADTICPGSKQAYIEFPNGKRIILGDSVNRLLKNIEGITLMEEKAGVVVLGKDSLQGKSPVVEKSRIVVPRGGEYQMVLSDGTKVWLNSDSKLEFPNAFTGHERRVRLFGEAYFEVAKNKAMPFRVEVEDVEVVVLGTSFNIYAYDEVVKTTLVEGAVRLDVEGNSYRLNPGFEADVSHGQVKIAKADVYEQVAWKEGKFVFREKRLEEVMSVLSRWYDFEIFYQNTAVKDLHFTGNIPRHATINEVLKFLERTHLVHFSIVGRTVIISA